jgi:hypothetical protein
MLRYQVFSSDGAAVQIPLDSIAGPALFADSVPGPLHEYFRKLIADGSSWGSHSALPSATPANLMNSKKVSISTFSITTTNGLVATSASIVCYNTGAVNVIEVTGGLVGTTALVEFTQAVVEIRFHQSGIR